MAALQLAPEQEGLVASNLFSIAECQFDSNARPRAILAGKRVIGFLMYDVHRVRGKTQALIYRFMIDRKQQGRGYGGAALAEALREIRQNRDIEKVSILYKRENTVALSLYRSFGFVERGTDDDGDVVAELRL